MGKNQENKNIEAFNLNLQQRKKIEKEKKKLEKITNVF